jgi:hypothetical protein
MINHSLNIVILPNDPGITISDTADAPTTNSVPSYVQSSGRMGLFLTLLYSRIMANANGCAPLGGNRYPNFVLLYFIDIRNRFAAADQIDGFS